MEKLSCLSLDNEDARKFGIVDRTRLETNLDGVLANSTMIFSLLQVIWQVVFLTCHVYCVCFNIRTDGWINWNKYPEFQLIAQSQPGESFTSIQFKNPYDKGIVQNVKEFLKLKG